MADALPLFAEAVAGRSRWAACPREHWRVAGKRRADGGAAARRWRPVQAASGVVVCVQSANGLRVALISWPLGPREKIVLARSEDDGNVEIFTMDPIGSDPTRLTRRSGGHATSSPNWGHRRR